VLATAVAKRGLGNPLTDQDLVSSVVSQLQVDSGFSFSHMINLVRTYHAVNINKSPQLTLPVMVVNSLEYQYDDDWSTPSSPRIGRGFGREWHRCGEPGHRDGFWIASTRFPRGLDRRLDSGWTTRRNGRLLREAAV
jgi:hypothetical protein